MTAAELIKSVEGCKLQAYPDIGGKYTIGWGSTGSDIRSGVVWTQKQADDRLAEDIVKFTAGVKELVKSPINENQLTALVSFVYNLGLANLKRSGLLKQLNAGRYKEAAEQFLLWDHVGLYRAPGLTARRQKEREVFLKPAPTPVVEPNSNPTKKG